MISEKTVELNLTTELVNYFYVVTGVRPYILAPSQPQEATYGFDTSIGFPGASKPFLIQYKRAEYRKRKKEYLYHLNRTATQDQHLRLYILELLGWDVFYALPLFHLPSEIITHRQHLLPKTLYVKPSSMIPVGGVSAMTGHHEVRHNAVTGVTTIYSEEGKRIRSKFNLFDYIRSFNNIQQSSDITLLSFLKDFNRVFSNTEQVKIKGITLSPTSKDDNQMFKGQSIIVK